MAVTLDTSIQYLKGVGEKRAALYRKLDIHTIRDLLYFFPRSYLDLSSPTDIAACPSGTPCTIRARVLSHSREQRIRKGLSRFKVQVADDTGSLILTFFNAKYTAESLKQDEEYLFYGKVTNRQMPSPLCFPASTPTRLLPIYPLTQGLSSKMLHANALQALELLYEQVPDPIPAFLRREYNLCHLHYALQNVHNPASPEALDCARRRLVFEEFFTLSLCLSTVRSRHVAHTAYRCPDRDLSAFTASLPFSLTDAQQRAIDDLCRDLASPVPMNRLVQGDVGSGKTMVAAAGCYLAWKNGFQSALMAPTEILAQQHHQGLSRLLEPLGLRVGLLTGSLTAKEKRTLYQQLADGSIDLCVGTHALLSQGVEFARLALVVTDEQHRFGVAQRARLSEKSDHPHTLVMSATPIPRTLALMVYGDLAGAVIDQLPPSRQPVQTFVIDSSKKLRAYRFIQDHLDRGLQAYIVCPLVESDEDTDPTLQNVQEYAAQLQEGPFCSYRVGLLHGKRKPREKDAVMADFSAGRIQLLVSTTVVEVGVDVPNAVVMMIENAERFGLSQLHQLRGRVGRGQERSTCILVSDNKNPDTRARLELMHQTNDGFRIAEYDLKTRGPGDFLGKRQHGLPQLRIADLSGDMEVLMQAQQAAQQAFARKQELTRAERDQLNACILRLMHSVGERLN